jgi:TetR/AcrR family transcriptional regulator, cholesterol catabolism regulator
MSSVLSEQQVQRRDRVVAAAMELAAEGGYDAVQMRAVSTLADVALGTIYRYFSSKDQLLLAGLDRLAEDMQANLRQRPARGSTPHERVADVFQRSCALLESQPKLTQAVVTALSSSDATVRDIAPQVHERLRAIIATAAVGGDEVDGEAAAVELEDVVHVLGLVWFAAMMSWVGGRTPGGTMAADLELASRLLLGPR